MMGDRKCYECFEQLRGRTDQKFCSDQCRSSYNNKQNIETNIAVKSINRILKKNYTILKNLNSDGKSIAKKGDLVKKGYKFEYFTCTSTTRNNLTNYFCYDQGYREKENNKVIIFQRNFEEDLSSTRVYPILSKTRSKENIRTEI